MVPVARTAWCDAVIPAKAGTQAVSARTVLATCGFDRNGGLSNGLGSGFRRNDEQQAV
jgi:hypothetical protein